MRAEIANDIASDITKSIDGLILAAGRSSRMDGLDKSSVLLAGIPLLEHVVQRLSSQVADLFINANANIENISLTVIGDALEGFHGPLTGLWSALKSDQISPAQYLMMVPCDGPFIPDSLVAELHASITAADADIACVRYQGFAQPTFSLWHKRVLPSVEEALLVKKQGGFKPLLEQLSTAYLDWPEQPINPFFNINTAQDLADAERLLT